MDFTAVVPANQPSRRQAPSNTIASSSLPPLLPSSGEFTAVASSPRPHLEKQSPRVGLASQVASWPLTFAPGSPTQRAVNDSTAAFDAFSPLSPKTHRLHARARLVDDSRTRPVLLQELQSLLQTGLDGGNDSPAAELPPIPSLRRLQIVREALGRLIAGFSVYAPVLARIRDEYESAVASLRAQSIMVPGLHSRLQSVETHCLKQLSTNSVEAKARSVLLKRRLAETQAMLAASAAENARLQAELLLEQTKLTQAGNKHIELQRSTLALANSVRRHDESLHAAHERSLEDAKALQQVTAKYYHACDELAELKKTVAALEEQGSGQHVAADKSVILLLTRELQELHTLTVAGASRQDTKQHEEEANTHLALNHAFVQALDAVGLPLDFQGLLDGVRNGEDVAAGLKQKLRELQQRQIALLSPPSNQPSPVLFLTEPVELVTFGSSLTRQQSGDFLAGRELGTHLPESLRHDGFVRNLFLPRTKVEQLVSQVWDQLDELVKPRRSHVNSLASPAQALERALSRIGGERVELAYNLLASLERFSPQSSDCRLFQLVLRQELPVEARIDLKHELSSLHDALLAVDRDRHCTTLTDASASTELSLPPGQVSLADVVQILRLTFPWKTETAFSQLHRALLVDLRGQPQTDYTALLAVALGSSKPHERRQQFAECLRMQRLDDLLAFRRHIQRQIRSHIGSETDEQPAESDGAAIMISLRDLRSCLNTADPAMPEPEAMRILSAVSTLTARELLVHDDMMLDTRQVLRRLPTLLLRPTGRFLLESCETSPK
ncbi:hypothetical protein BBJ28_00016360 [Nothophytophthora sp. Chile5]|nr:hypothetical protein BBJ28_00016360 [Nothophytophthora sp. Chile5]